MGKGEGSQNSCSHFLMGDLVTLSMVNRIRNEDPRSPVKFKQCPLKGGTEKSDTPRKEDVQGRIRERNLIYPRTESTKPNAYELTGVVLWVQLWPPVRYI